MRAGIKVQPSSTKEEMISFLIGMGEPPPLEEDEHVIDSWRIGITRFVFEYWARLEPQITCPIKSKDPRSCFGCLDTQAITCVVQTQKYEHLINAHRRSK